MKKKSTKVKTLKKKTDNKITPWTITTHLNKDKENKWLYYQPHYNAFMINKVLSYHPETLFYANEMNKSYKLTHEEQYLFYLYSINPKKNRFAKYHGIKKLDDDITKIMEEYQVNKEVAKQYLKIKESL